MRVLGVFSSLLGNRGYNDALRIALDDLGAESTIITLEPGDFRRYPPSRWARLSEPLAAQAVLSAKARTATGPWDAVLVQGWELLPVARRIAGATPTMVAMDVPPRAAARTLRETTPGWRGHLKSRLGEAYHAWRFDAASVDVFLPWTPWCSSALTVDHGITGDRQIVTLLPIDTEVWHPGVSSGGLPTILFVGNDWQRKGGPMLLDAYRRLAPHARLVIVSHDPEVAALPAMPGVTVYRGLPRAELPALFRSADIFCLPTRREYAGFVFAEACASGLPVLGTNVGGVSSFVRDGWNGYLLPADASPAAWTDRLLRLATDPALRHRMGANGRRLAEEALSQEAFTWRIERALSRLTGYTSSKIGTPSGVVATY